MAISRLRLFSLSMLMTLPALLLLIRMPTAAMQPAALEAAPVARIQTASSGSQAIIAGAGSRSFGSAVAVSGDILAASSIYAEVQGVTAGAVYLYGSDPQAANGWREMRTLYREPPQSLGAFGEALALQGDTLVVGVPRDPRDPGGFWQGAVYVYERNHGGTNAWGLVIQLSDEASGNSRQFGSAVAVDGDLVAVGVQGADARRGKVYLYSRAAQWARIKTLVDPDGKPGDEFGSAVALDGDTLVVGARYGDARSDLTNTGAAFVFGRDQGGTGQWGLVTRLIADIPATDSSFGDTLALDGETVVVGASNEAVVVNGQLVASQVGAAYVYERGQGGSDAWGLAAALRPADGRTTDRYGSSLALAGDDLWIGAPGSSAGGFGRQGIVYQYRRNQSGASAWGALPLIEADGGSRSHEFGAGLAVHSNTLVVSAPGYAQVGAVYVIDLTDTPNPTAETLFLPVVMREAIPSTGLLADGGTLQEPGGAILGAVPGTLDAPVEATIAETRRPFELMPGGFTPSGSYYHVSARSLTIGPADKPLLVGLPVPEGADTTRLAVATLLPDGYESGDEIPDAPTRSWTEQPGSYDAANNLFVTTLRALLPEGATLVLFEHPNNVPLPATEPALLRQNANVEYFVTCSPASQSLDGCTLDNFALVKTELEAAHALFVGAHGFRPPALVHLAGVFVGPDMQPQLREVYHNAVVRTAPCINRRGESVGGQYNYITMRLMICMGPENDATRIKEVVRHELFHAIQAAYQNVAKDYLALESRERSIWTVEGTATAAMRSSFLMLRSPDYFLREASEPLTSTVGLNEYRAQDFWVYTGLEGPQANRYIEYLKPIFERGATPEHVSEAMPLREAYWAWAKNQVFEHQQPMINAFVNGPCQLEAATISIERYQFMLYPGQITAEGSLPPLTSALVKIEVEPARAIMPVRAYNSTSTQDLRYKVYVQGETDCASVPDNARILFRLLEGSTIFVLVSNVSLTEAFDFTVEVD